MLSSAYVYACHSWFHTVIIFNACFIEIILKMTPIILKMTPIILNMTPIILKIFIRIIIFIYIE